MGYIEQCASAERQSANSRLVEKLQIEIKRLEMKIHDFCVSEEQYVFENKRLRECVEEVAKPNGKRKSNGPRMGDALRCLKELYG